MPGLRAHACLWGGRGGIQEDDSDPGDADTDEAFRPVGGPPGGLDRGRDTDCS